MTAMNRSNRLKNKNSRRFSFSNILAKEVLLERMEDRIVPAYVSGDFGWAASFETGNVNVVQIVRSSTIDSAGNVYQVGSFTGTVDFDPGAGTTVLTSLGSRDSFVVKLDTSGNLVWVKAFQGLQNESAESITTDPTGKILIAGWYQGTVDFDPNIGVYNLTSKGLGDAFIIQLDTAGVLQWAKSIGSTTNDDGGECITTDSAGNILIGGTFNGTVDFDPGIGVATLSASNFSSSDLFILKLNSSGNYIWAKVVLGLNNNFKFIEDIKTDSLNNVILAGIFNGTIDLDPGTGTYSISTFGGQDSFITKFDSNGAFKWGQQIGSTAAYDYSDNIAIDTKDNIYVAGEFGATVDFDNSSSVKSYTPVGLNDSFLLKVATDDTFQWVKTWGGSGYDYAKAVSIDNNSRIKVFGCYSNTVDFDPGAGVLSISANGNWAQNGWDFYLSLFDTSGDFFGVKTFGQINVGDDNLTMCLNPSGNPVLTGYFSGLMDFDPDAPTKSLSTVGGTNVFLTQWNRQFTKTTVTVSDSFTGANTTLTATIQNEKNTSSTTGTVTFTDLFNGTTTTLGTANVVNGVATLTLPTLATGVHNFSAAYSGDSTNFSSASNPVVTQLDAVAGSWGWAQAFVNRTGLEEQYPVTVTTTDSQSNVYYAGSFSGSIDFRSGTGTELYTAKSSKDFFVAKFTPTGSLIWFRQWSNNSLFFSNITIDSQNRINLTGFFSGTFNADPTPGGTKTLTSSGMTDGMVLRMATSGNFIDALSIGGTGEDCIHSIAYDSNSNMVAGGFFSNTVDFDISSTVTNKTSLGGKDGFVAKYSSNGILTWVIPLSSASEDYIYSVAIDTSNNVYTYGKTYGTVDLDPSSSATNTTNAQILAKYSPTGSLLNVSQGALGAPYFIPTSLVVSNSSVYISGNNWINGIWMPFFSKLSPSLSSLWVNQLTSTTNSSQLGIVVDQNNSVFLCGAYTGNINLDPLINTPVLISKGSQDFFIAAYNTDGKYLKSFSFGGSGLDGYMSSFPYNGSSYTSKAIGEFIGSAITVCNNGAVILTGGFQDVVDFDPTSASQTLTAIPANLTKSSRFLINLSNYAVVTTATSLTTTPTTSVYGQSITLNAALNALNGATPSGLTASFYDGATLIGTSTVTNGIASLSLANLAVGSHSFTAKIVDATNAYLTSTSTAVAFTVSKSESKLTLTGPPSSIKFGNSASFTANVAATAPGAGSPTGTVQFYDGSTLLGSATVNSSGDASYSTSALAVGTHTITATYAGDTNFNTSTSTAFSQTVVSGVPTSLTISAGNNQATTVANDFATLLQVRATDSSGNPVPNASVTFTINANGASGSFASSGTVTTNASGYATAPKINANTVAGNFTVTVSATGVSNVVFNLTNTAGAASAIVLTSGNNQNATVNTAFAQALQAKVTDAYGNPITGIPVTFGVPSTGATGSFAASNIVTTNASGLATAPTLTANTVSGSYQVSTTATGLNTQNFNLTNNPGAASTIAIQDGNNQSATVGAAFAKSLQVVAKDAYGNTVPGVSVTFTEPNTGATGTFASSVSVTTNSVGVATSPAFTANTVSGSYQVVASANGLTSQNFNLTNNAGIATGFAIAAGNNQTVTVGNAFATNLQVKATDTYGNGVPGVSVQFSAPGSGASGSFAGSNLVTSNNQGIAIAPTFTSNTIAGSYTVLASATGLPIQTFTLTNSTSGATIAVTAGNNQSATVGSGFGTPLQVRFSDSFGNPVSGVSVTFAAPINGSSGSFNGSSTVTSNASGIATAPTFTANGKAGNFTLTASAANVGSVNFNLTNTAGAASAIVLASGNNQMTTVNTSFGSPLMAKVTDVYGNPVQNVSVTFSGPGSGSLAVFGGSTIVSSNADGIVASPTISANTVAGTYTVTASASNVTSAQFTLTNAAGLPTSIVKTGGNNQGASVNTAFAAPLSVKISDSYGNPVPNISVAFSGPLTGSSLAFSGASTVATNALGVATTPAISANSNAGTYIVQAYLNDSVTANFTLTNLAGMASKLVLMAGTNQSTTVNTAFPTSLQVQVTDAFGNPVSNSPVTFTGPASGAGITLTGNQNANSNSSGLAIWSAFTANQVAGNYVVVASIAGGSNLNFALSNKAGAATIATVTAGANQSTVVNTGFGSSLQVKVTDTFGNPVSNVPVTFTAPSNGASVSFSASPSLNTNSDGVVNSPTLTANTVAGNYVVTANVGSLGQSTFSMTNLAGAASAIIKTSGNNQSTVVNTAFSNPLQLKVTDAYGNAVANVPVSFIAPTSGASLVLASTGAGTTNAQGIVSSPAITANTVAGNFAVNVTANGNINDSFSLTNLAGAASNIIKTSGNNQSTVVNTTFTNPLQLKVTDAFGNPVANVPVSFTAANSGASLVLGSTTPVSTNAQGIVTSPAITANTIAGSYSVNVTANGNVSDSFTFTNLAGAAAKFTITAGDKQSTTVNTSFASGLKVLVTDTFNNPVTNTPVTFTVPSSGASVVLAGSNAINTNSTGNATLDGLTANKVAGSFTVLATVSNLQTLNLNLANNPGAVSSLVPVNGNNQSAVINGSFPTALQVKVLDAFGNAVPNVPVSFTSPTTGASAKFIGATSANSDNSGVASLSGLIANGVVGSYSVTATATGASNATFALRNAAPTVQSLVVQQGGTGRSFVRYVDLNINDATTVNTLVSSLSGSAPKIRITNTGLDGKAKRAVVIKGLTKASGNMVKIDFGTKGVGGNAATNVGDGSYLIEMDLDGNGSFETSQRFFRLLGDVNGDKIVDAKDTALVKASLNKTGSNLPADTNGDGKVNASDTSYVARAQRRRIRV
jgi:hypothetical protein